MFTFRLYCICRLSDEYRESNICALSVSFLLTHITSMCNNRSFGLETVLLSLAKTDVGVLVVVCLLLLLLLILLVVLFVCFVLFLFFSKDYVDQIFKISFT